ncbi:MAG: LysR family transcriptional regulator [Oscillospiraceae bacterium]|nr:LysR family transcriptional regulator [Oscillospiraceae bacterium]
MELRHLLYFKRVAETEHLTKAANDLYISQSHLSHVIIELEAELGVQLFDRVGRGIQLNPCGKEFYHDIVRLLYEFEDSKKKIQATYKRQSTQVTIVTNVSTYMPGLLKKNKQDSPDLNIQQYSAKRRRIIRMLLDGDADFAICCPLLTEEPELESILLHMERGVIVYPAEHWLNERKSVGFGELKDENFISVGVGYGTRDMQDVYFKEAGIFVNSSVETTDTSSIYNFVKSGLGIALAPKTMTMLNTDFKYQFVELDEGPLASIGLTWRKDHYIGDAGKAFYETTKNYFEGIAAYM